jgi:hypothetical protein
MFQEKLIRSSQRQVLAWTHGWTSRKDGGTWLAVAVLMVTLHCTVERKQYLQNSWGRHVTQEYFYLT